MKRIKKLSFYSKILFIILKLLKAKNSDYYKLMTDIQQPINQSQAQQQILQAITLNVRHPTLLNQTLPLNPK